MTRPTMTLMTLWFGSLLAAWACSSEAGPVDGGAGGAGVDALQAGGLGPYTVRRQLDGVATGADGRSGLLEIAVPEAATAVVITVRGDARDRFILAELADGAGMSIVPKAWISLAADPGACWRLCPNRLVAQPGEAAFLVPNTPLVELEPGRLRLRVYAYRSSGGAAQPVATTVTVRLDFVIKDAARRASGSVRLNLGLTGAGGLSAATALAAPRVAKAMGIAAQIYAKVGITLRFRAFDALDQQLIATHDGPDADLSRLLRSGAGQPLGVNVFLVDKVLSTQPSGPGESILAGRSGGIPGPPLAVGGVRSGIALSLHLSPGQQDTLGVTLAHELGHFLGLFHTVEMATGAAPPLQDNLPDTDPREPNLMHYVVRPDASVLTPDQRFVLHNSPWVVPDAP